MSPDIAEDSLRLVLGPPPGYDRRSPLCGSCGHRETVGVLAGITAVGVNGRICESCATGAGPFGEALVGLVEGIDSISDAVQDLDDRRSELLAMAAWAVGWMQETAEAIRD